MGIADDLEALAALHQSGQLTPEEYAKAKAAILNGQPSPNRFAIPGPSRELLNYADKTLIWGLLCILLGWTFLVPLGALAIFAAASEQAKKEQQAIPVKAFVGLLFALFFGVIQCIAVIARLSR